MGVTAGTSVLIVNSISDKLSPTGRLVSGMSEAAGVLVIVGTVVGAPVATAELPEVLFPLLMSPEDVEISTRSLTR